MTSVGFNRALLGGSWDLVSRVISTLIGVISNIITIVTLLITLVTKSHAPPSMLPRSIEASLGC